MDDRLIAANPARGLFRHRRTKARAASQTAARTVKALTRAQRDRFLDAAAARDPETYTGFLIGFPAGLRPGEILGLRWADVDVRGRRLRVHR